MSSVVRSDPATKKSMHLWSAGSILNIRFLDGSDTIKEKVAKIAVEWTAHALLGFRFLHSDDTSELFVGGKLSEERKKGWVGSVGSQGIAYQPETVIDGTRFPR